MSKKLLFFTCIIALFSMSSAWSAIPVDRDWSNGGGNQLWNNTANWSGAVVPTSADKAAIRGNFTSATGPLINSTITAVANEVVIGDHGSTIDTLNMTGGSLTTSGTNPWIIVGYGTPNNGTINISGGTITVGSTLFIGFWTSANGGGIGNLNMTAGAINVTGALGVAQGGNTAQGTILLHGGTLTAGSLAMGNANALIDITTGTLTVTSTANLSTYITNGWIKAYGGTGTLNVSGGTVTATPPVTGKAYGPVPANAATNISNTATVSWTAGVGATSHNVYFGTVNPPAFIGNQTALTYNPGGLAFNKTYYWRIDEVSGTGTTTGDVWSFTVKSGQASSPDPANGALGVDTTKILNWTPGFDGASHDIYLGTNEVDVTNAALLAGDLNRSGCVDWLDVQVLAQNWLQNMDFENFAAMAPNWVSCTSSVFKNSQPGNTYTAALLPNTTYFWRVDEVSGSTLVKGSVWTFSTPLAKASNPTPANLATAVVPGTALTWTPGAGAVSHDVYFGTANPPASVGNQPAATYTPLAAGNTTYYWRIDEVSATGTTTGDVWSFTTGAAIPTDRNWVNGTDRLWKTADNWSGHIVPTSVDKAAIRTGVADGPIVDSTTTAVANECVVGDWSSANDNITITGGSLTLGGLNNWLILGYQAANHGTMTVTGGMVSIPDPCGNMFVGFIGAGTVNMTGGTIDVGQAFGVGQSGGSGQVNLDGGTITADSLTINGTGSIVDINNGTFIIRGDARTAVNDLVTAGKLTGYNGLGSIAADFNNVNPGMTTVTGTFAKAHDPIPQSGATGVLATATLSWTAGQGAVSHNVYFGTANPPASQGNQTAATFDTGAMAPATTYYWRIDEVAADSSVTEGTVWSFRTQELKAANPSPANNATGVATSIFLQWSPGYGATAHDVYFGTTNPPPFLETTDIEASDPGTLAQGVTYFWRVDEVSGSGTTTGDVWQFQTQLPPPPANLRKGPYLIYPANNTQMSVLFQLTATSSATVAWGTDTTYSTGTMTTTEYGTDHQHRANITGLTPGTKYYYRVTIGTGQIAGSFNAAPAASATAVKLFMYGDTRSNPGINNTCANRMLQLYAADPAIQTICLHAGDWVSGDGESQWTSEWFTNNSTTTQLYELMRNVPIAGCAGNHEGGGAPVYSKYMPQPYVANHYYSFDYGPIHIAIVDMYNGYASPSAQYTWLVNDLSTSTKQWKMIIFHEPAWNGGGSHGNNATAQATFQPLAQTYGAQICMAGHNHFYSRCAVPLSGTHIIQHITHGAGGAPYYSYDSGQPYVVAGVGNTPVVGKLEINGSTLTHTAYNASTGSVVDTVSIDRTTW